MEVNTVLDTFRAANERPPEPVSDNASLGQDTFLRLFIAQLQNQDPLNPSANEEFVAQLAQFSSLEQSTRTSSLLEDLISQGRQRSQVDLVGLIGHRVIASGNTVQVEESLPTSLRFDLEENAQSIRVAIGNESGQVVRTLTLGPQTSGSIALEWDGLNADDEPVPTGTYRFTVEAVNADKESVPTTTFLTEVVESTRWANGQAELILGSGRSLLSEDIISVL